MSDEETLWRAAHGGSAPALANLRAAGKVELEAELAKQGQLKVLGLQVPTALADARGPAPQESARRAPAAGRSPTRVEGASSPGPGALLSAQVLLREQRGRGRPGLAEGRGAQGYG